VPGYGRQPQFFGVGLGSVIGKISDLVGGGGQDRTVDLWVMNPSL
jgi:hypothetical protein